MLEIAAVGLGQMLERVAVNDDHWRVAPPLVRIARLGAKQPVVRRRLAFDQFLQHARELRRGTLQLVEDIAPYRKLGIEPPALQLLINRVPAVSTNARLIQQTLRLIFHEQPSVRVLDTEIPAIEAFPRAATQGQPVHRVEHRRPSGRQTVAALEIVRCLANELFPPWQERFAAVTGKAGGRVTDVERS